jgi:hypothetical protein
VRLSNFHFAWDAAKIEKQQAEIDASLAAVRRMQMSLVEREASIKERELEAEASFTNRFKIWITDFERQCDQLRDELSALRERIVVERKDWERQCALAHGILTNELEAVRSKHSADLTAERGRFDEELAQLRTDLDRSRSELRMQVLNFSKEQGKLRAEQDVLEESRTRIGEQAARLAAARVEELKAELAGKNDQLAVARQERDRLSSLFNLREEAFRQFGEKSPEDIVQELRTLEKECVSLRSSLSLRPTLEDAARLRELEVERERREANRVQLFEENQALKFDLARAQIIGTEIETIRDQKTAVEKSRDLIHTALENLRKEVEETIRQAADPCPFPSCSAMDKDPDLQRPMPVRRSLSDLTSFVGELQHRMACDPPAGKSLFYSLRDTRSFVAGLAMSRLVLLKGLSGTGKTSLPAAFAGAIGAGCTLIDVQADWRNRRDLLGQFDTAKGVFRESAFLQALYRAGCAKHVDRPYIVVLDEMNLSHPEQYFADFLSALEQDAPMRKLDLLNAPVKTPPALFKDGKSLPIPGNVWFVGTANHDETTNDFANKTYDRAHVMTLPQHSVNFEVKYYRDAEPLSVEALVQAFDAASHRYGSQAVKAITFLNEQLGPALNKNFRIGWGNRLEKQMAAYIPVVLAGGGSLGEAVDDIFAGKILRKIVNRHENRPEHVKILMDEFISGMESFDPKWLSGRFGHEHVRSLAILKQEHQRLAGHK